MKQIEEKMILIGMIVSEKYFSTVFPFLDASYFEQKHTRLIYTALKKYFLKYNRKPNIEVLEVLGEKIQNLSDEEHEIVRSLVSDAKRTKDLDEDWLCDETEVWIRNRKYFNAIFHAAEEFDEGRIDASVVKEVEEALSFSFDPSVGMEFSEIEKRWEIYSKEDEKIPFKLNFLNAATNGGVSRKTLNMLMSSKSGGGKSLVMCDLATDYIRCGYNVVYFTMEMSEDKIFERVDANLLSVPIQNLRKLGKEQFVSRMTEIQTKINGKLVVKQYPTATAHVGHMRHFLNELRMKRGIVPDVLIFDYLNIIVSQRAKEGNIYSLVKATAEELRGLVVENNCVGWTATQSNRSGISAEENLSTDNVSDSVGTLFTADLLIGLVTTEELDADNKILLKILKNRYGDISKNTKGIVGIRREFMRLEELDDGITTRFPDMSSETDDFSSAHTVSKQKKDYRFGGFN